MEQAEHTGVSDWKNEKQKGKKLGESEVVVTMTPPVLIHNNPVQIHFVPMGQNKKKEKINQKKPRILCSMAYIPRFSN